MKKNGFTLVEIIAVISILALLLMFAMPSILGIIKDNEIKEKEAIDNRIIIAAGTFYKENIAKFNVLSEIGDTAYVKLSTLIKYGVLSKPLVDPITKKEINYNDLVEYEVISFFEPFSITYPTTNSGTIID